MKKVLIGLVVIVVALGGVFYYLASNLDGILKQVIETQGSSALGTDVRVDSVAVDLRGGTATINGFRVANPDGFSDADMMRFDELHVALDLASISSDVLRINTIRSTNPYMRFELQGTRSNIQAIRDRFPPSAAEEPAQPTGPEPVIALDDLTINGIQGTLQSDQLPRPVDVSFGSIQVTNVEGTPEVLAQQIARSIMSQLANNARDALESVASGAIEAELENRVNEATDSVRNRINEELQDADPEIQQAAEALQNRLGF
jgi:hypothetical protein